MEEVRMDVKTTKIQKNNNAMNSYTTNKTKNRKAFSALEFIFFIIFFALLFAILAPKFAAWGWL